MFTIKCFFFLSKIHWQTYAGESYDSYQKVVSVFLFLTNILFLFEIYLRYCERQR